jgi:hypothetical protein
VIGTDSVVDWTVPSTTGNFIAHCSVDDGRGGTAADSIAVEVRDSTQQQTGQLILYLPFTGNANDSSGNHHDGVVHGAQLTLDRYLALNRAYAFDGVSAFIQVPNAVQLNFQQAITVSFWMKIGAFTSHEEHPISHGSWQNRWKVSIGSQHLRWTVKTASGTKDLDSPTLLGLNRFYHVAVTYSGSDVELYLDGYLDAFAPWSGALLPTVIDLTIGQVLPTDPNYNFTGVLDDIRLYDYALSYQAIQDLASGVTAVNDEPGGVIPRTTWIGQNYPNPFNPSTRFDFQLATSEFVAVRIYDVLGREIATLVHQSLHPGKYSVTWDARDQPTGVYIARFETSGTQLIRKILFIR